MAVNEMEEDLLAADGGGQDSRPRSAMSNMSDQVTELVNKIRRLQTSDTTNSVQDQLRIFVEEWKHETVKEKTELESLKLRVQKRKALRLSQESTLAEMRLREEQLHLEQLEEERAQKQRDKLKRIEDAEKRRNKLIEEEKGKNKRNFVIDQKSPSNDLTTTAREPTAEEMAVIKAAAMSIRIKPLGIEGLKKERLKRKAVELWEDIVRLQTECYDLEEIRKRQEYDYKELKERQKQQLRHKAMKLGLPAEALMGKYPPKILVASKYERRLGLKPFGETKDLFEGGFIKQYREHTDTTWKSRQELFTKRGEETSEVPPWLEDMPKRWVKEVEVEEEKKEEVVVEKMEDDAEEEEEEVEEDEEEEEEDGVEEEVVKPVTTQPVSTEDAIEEESEEEEEEEESEEEEEE